MAIAIVKHKELIEYANSIQFPINHRMNLDLGGLGFDVWDKYIRENVEWVNELDYKKGEHVKIWSSSKVSGPVPQPEDYFSRSIINNNGGNPIEDYRKSPDAWAGGSPCHANYISSTFTLSEKYIVDYVEGKDSLVAVEEYIRIHLGEKPEDTYLGYGITIPVERLWTILYMTNGVDRFWVERTYFPEIHGNKESFYVREINSTEEIEKHFEQIEDKWVLKVKETTTVEDVEQLVAPSFTAGEFADTETVIVSDAMKSTLLMANTMATIKQNIGV